MLRTWLIAAAAVLAPAAAGAVTVPAGQYGVTNVVTGLNDPHGICAPIITVGFVTGGVATLNGLGLAWTSTRVVVNTAPPYGVSTWECSYTPLPTAASFTAGQAPSNGSASCKQDGVGGGKLTYTVSNGPTDFGTATSTITVLPVSGKNDSLRLDATNVVVSTGATELCAINIQTVLVRTGR
jgi:hypothetical protein